jgi:hypothetical protein
MKKRWLTVCLLTASLFSQAQTRWLNPAQTKSGDSAYVKQTVAQTDIQLLFLAYNQTGDHSAVTGGKGTEALSVYAPEIAIAYRPNDRHSFRLNAGVDVITSASTDNIDYVRSSASRVDRRGHLNVGYSRRLRNPNLRAGIQSGVSLESDYLSLPLGVSLSHRKADGSREVTVGVQAYFDDLRWGRLNADYYRPVRLIYPVELRDHNWFDTYRRTSLNLTAGVYQTINRKLQAALFPEAAYQQGLLSTPFHRVYVNDSARTVRVERLPGERWKLSAGFQLNWFATQRVILRAYYRHYRDSFGIASHTVQLETPIRVTPLVTVSPLVRFYTQTAARDFRPYAEHRPDATFATSDYDLSAFDSYQLGLTIRYAPHQSVWKNYLFQAIDLRYAYYQRSDQLAAHSLSLVIELQKNRPRP